MWVEIRGDDVRAGITAMLGSLAAANPMNVIMHDSAKMSVREHNELSVEQGDRVLKLEAENRVLLAANRSAAADIELFKKGNRDLLRDNEELRAELKLKGRYGPYPLHIMNSFLVMEQMKNKGLTGENERLETENDQFLIFDANKRRFRELKIKRLEDRIRILDKIVEMYDA